MKRKKSSPKTRYRNDAFLKALGEHCLRLRSQRGYSIDRMAKESEQLSPSVIHRLETGGGAVTVSALYRYAEVLGVPLRQLLDFDEAQASGRPASIAVHAADDTRIQKQAFTRFLPLYSLKAAAGSFGKGRAVEPEGWVDLEGALTLDRKMFVARAVGESMVPLVQDGDLIVFRADPGGSRQGRVVLAQFRGPADPETGGAYTLKRYSSVKMASGGGDGEWRHRQITLSPANPAYEPIVLSPKDEADFRVVAEAVGVLRENGFVRL